MLISKVYYRFSQKFRSPRKRKISKIKLVRVRMKEFDFELFEETRLIIVSY